MFLLLSLLLILFFPLSYASENFADFKKEWYLVNVPVAKVYESPDNASGYTEKTLYGHFVEKLKIENTEADFFLEWVKIKKENQATGFMMRQELTSDNILWRTDVNLKRICILCASIFTFPSFHNSKVIMKLPYNAYVNS
ncbi:MAG TPA: hypothetical protein VL201_03120, partial [Patescibacteria group bacterium]|nr:hypothetical protein [Patescibacteria group bacterium]